MVKVGIFLNSPDIFLAPLWRILSRVEDLKIKVFYFSDICTDGYSLQNKTQDGNDSVLAGYQYEFIKSSSKKPQKLTLDNPEKLLNREKFDVVMLCGYHQPYERQIRKLAHDFNFKIIFRGEITDMQRSPNIFTAISRHLYLRWFYSGISAFCPIGRDAENHLLDKGIPEGKLFFSPNAVDDQFIENQKNIYKREVVREELGIGENNIVFLFSGSMDQCNQPLLLAEAVMELSDYPQLVMIFIGDGKQYHDVCKMLTAKFGNRVFIPGYCDQERSSYFFAAADVFVLPSEYDPWCLAVNQAMHWGMPVIVSDRCGCCRDLVIDGYTGYSFYYRDKESLVRYIRKFLVEPELSSKMGRSAYKEIRNYTLEQSVSGITEAIKYVTGRVPLSEIL